VIQQEHWSAHCDTHASEVNPDSKGQQVGHEHRVADGDIVELHA